MRVLKSIPFFLTGFVLAWTLIGFEVFSSTSQSATAVIADASESVAQFVEQMREEEEKLFGALPDGECLIIIQVNASAKTILEAELSTESRPMVNRELEAIEAVGLHTDLGDGLKQAARLLSPFSGRKRIFVFTDGEARPLRSSEFFGKSLADIVNNPAVVPDDVEVVVRLYGSTEIATDRRNIHIFRDTPNWSEYAEPNKKSRPENQISMPEVRTPVPQAPEPAVKPNSRTWVSVGAIVVMLALLGGGWLWRVKRVGKKLTGVEEKMRQPVRMPSVNIVPSSPTYQKQVMIEIAQTGEVVVLNEQRSEVVIGGRWDAEVYLAQCGSAAVRILLSPAHRTGLALENCGRSPVSVGRLEVLPGQSQWLPVDGVQILVGHQLLHVFLEIIVINPENQGGKDNVRLNV